METIGRSAFEGCSGLTGIELPEELKTIGEAAFDGCDGLTKIELPQGLEIIGNWAFESSLTDVFSKPLTPPTHPNAHSMFGSMWVGRVLHVYVPRESVEVYKSNSSWEDFDIIGYDF